MRYDTRTLEFLYVGVGSDLTLPTRTPHDQSLIGVANLPTLRVTMSESVKDVTVLLWEGRWETTTSGQVQTTSDGTSGGLTPRLCEVPRPRRDR